MARSATEVVDLTVEDTTEKTRSLQNLKKNLSHMLISASKDVGPEITFGETVLIFKPQVPASAMTELISSTNKLEGLKNYIRLTLTDDSKEPFELLMDDVPLEALNEIVETISEAAVPFPTPS